MFIQAMVHANHSTSRRNFRSALVESEKQSYRIAVIDDEPQMLLMLAALLEAEGFIVDSLANMKVALEHFAQVTPDLILLDWELPDMDGVTACGAIRLHIDTRVIMLTARGSEADRVAGFTAGADDYVTKPFLPSELIARIHNALRKPPNTLA